MTIVVPMPRSHPRPKAEVGSFVGNVQYNTPLSVLSKSPQKKAASAQELYRSNPWVRKAENTVSGKVAGLPWHLENADEEELDDDTLTGSALVAYELLNHPQAVLPPEARQPGISTWHDLSKITSRHAGLCGTAFWYLDGAKALGYPTALMVISPTRMYDVWSKSGTMLLGYTLDKSMEEGGMPLELSEVAPFYLDPPDNGAWGLGLAEVIFGKAQLSVLSDRHIATTLKAGGRLTGIVSPKEGAVVSEDAWVQFVRDYRNITEDDDSAKRLQIAKGPIDYTRTAATMSELQVVDISRTSRDDIFSVWGVPLSQASVNISQGLNSGETKGFDEAVLMQGAVHDRVTPLMQTIQARVIDALDPTLAFVIEEPSFDDELPQYTIAQTAQNQPLTNNERREIMGKDPLPDWDPITGEPLGTAIYIPATMVTVGAAPAESPRPNIAPPTPPAPVVPPPVPDATPPSGTGGTAPVKAARGFLHLRETVDKRYVPAARKSVEAVLAAQRSNLAAAYLASPGKKVPGWNQTREEERMLKALRPHVAALAETVTNRMSELLPHKAPAKADAWQMRVEQSVLSKVAARVKNITETTRLAIQRIIDDGIAAQSSPMEIASAIEGATAFDPYRAEMIALTEMGKTYNESALGSYSEFGVASVEAVDGDQDDACAARDGQTFSLDDADAETADEHPNGTLDWVPIIEEAKAMRGDIIVNTPPVNITMPPTDNSALMALILAMTRPEAKAQDQPTIVVNVPRQAPPVVNVTVPEPRVVVAPPSVKRVVRDSAGRIIEIVEE